MPVTVTVLLVDATSISLIPALEHGAGSGAGRAEPSGPPRRFVLNQFDPRTRLGGVIAAVEHRYQRSQIQAAAHQYEEQINSSVRPIIGLNRYAQTSAAPEEMEVIRTPRKKKQQQLDRLAADVGAAPLARMSAAI